MDRTYYCVDDPEQEVTEDKRIKAYRYGKNTVPFNIVEESALQFESEKCLQVLGFTDKNKVPRHHFMGPCYQFIPKPYDENASIAFSSLVRALAEMDKVAIVRYVYRKNAQPQLGLLSPCIKTDYDCLYFNTLPFAEDLRSYPFKSFENIKFTDEQLKSTEDLIKSMDLMDAEEEEALKPSQTFNPIIQHLYECCHQRCLHPNDPLPKIDSVILKYCFPELHKDSCYSKIIKKSQDNIELFKKLFPLKKVDKEQKGKKRYWFATKEKDISLDSYQLNNKRQRVEETNVVSTTEKVDIDYIFSDKADHIGSVDPVKDFNEMFTRRDVDLVDRAIEEMQAMIIKLINDSINDQYYNKALNCLIALRKGCIDEEESESFNKFLRRIKTMYSTGKRKGFWELIKKNKLNLISSDECPDSNVTNEMIEKFYLDEIENPIEEKEDENSSEEKDLFDQLE